MSAKQQAFLDMAQEYQKEGKALIRESKKQLDQYFAIMINEDEQPDFYKSYGDYEFGGRRTWGHCCYMGGRFYGYYK